METFKQTRPDYLSAKSDDSRQCAVAKYNYITGSNLPPQYIINSLDSKLYVDSLIKANQLYRERAQ